jgi:hypothetical protein
VRGSHRSTAAAAGAAGFNVYLSWLEVVAPVAGNVTAQYWADKFKGGKMGTPIAAGSSTVQLAEGPYKYRFSNDDTNLNIIGWEPSVAAPGNGLVVKCFGGTFEP